MSNPEEGYVVVFYTRKISAHGNDVIHNASGPTVKFGKTSNLASAPKSRTLKSNGEFKRPPPIALAA